MKFLDDVEFGPSVIVTFNLLPTFPAAGADALVGFDATDAALAYFLIGSGLSYDHATHTLSAVSGGSGTVTTVSVVTANGVSGSVATATTTPAITLTLGAITPTSVNGVVISGSSTPTLAVTGTTTVSGVNTGDQTSVSGNAGTATALATPRNINGVAFDGTANITVTADAGTLTGATLAAGVTASSLTSVGTIATGVWNGTAVDATHGGTAQTSWATGDLLYASGTNTLAKLATSGVNNTFLRIFGGVPSWQTPALNITGPSTLLTWTTNSITNLSAGIPGAFTATLAVQNANKVFAGPTTGADAAPTFRVLVVADLPTVDAAHGGIGLDTSGSAIGGVLYLSATGTWAVLAQNTTATRYLSNKGTSNIPAWSQITLTDGVTGTLPVGNGGTGATTLTIHGVLLGQTTGAIVATAAMTDGQLLVGQTSSDPLPKTVTGDVTITAAGVTAIGSGKVTNAMLAGSIDLASKVTGVLPFANAPLTTNVDAWRITTAEALNNGSWTTIIFNNENTDALAEYDPTTGIFTPAVTGTYLISSAYTQSGVGQALIAVWVGTASEVLRFAQVAATIVGGTIMVDLTAATGYTIRAFVSAAGVTAALGQTLTYLKIRRLS